MRRSSSERKSFGDLRCAKKLCKSAKSWPRVFRRKQRSSRGRLGSKRVQLPGLGKRTSSSEVSESGFAI